MDFLSFLLIVGIVLIGLKCLGFVVRAGLFIISIPLLILAGVVIAILLFAVLPVAFISGLLGLVLIPLGILVPLLPLLLIGFGVYLLARR
jgi:hypothetical protein